MSTSAERALAAAIRSALRSDAAVQAVLGLDARFYDEPPPDPVFPYATFGRLETRAADSTDANALEHAVTIHIWSRYGGRAEALDIVGAVRDALHNKTITVENRRLTLLHATFSDTFRHADGRVTQGMLRLRAITESAL